MRLRFISRMLMAALFLAPSMGRASDVRDGTWWNNLSGSQKLAYVVGFLDGQTYTEQVFDGAALAGQTDPETNTWSEQRARILVGAEKMAAHQLDRDFGHVSATSLVAGLDKTYGDFRNTRLLVIDAMVVVVRGIGGMSDADLEQLLERKRKDASQ